MSKFIIHAENIPLGNTFPARIDRTYAGISYKFFFDLNLSAEQPFLVLRIKKFGESEYTFQNKLVCEREENINSSIRILPVFIKILNKEYGLSFYRRLSSQDEPNQLIFFVRETDVL